MKKNFQSPFTQRQYMLSEHFEIYYYEDLHFDGVAPHSHDYYEFYFFLEGSISMFIDGIPHKLKSGDVLLIPPEIQHHAVSHDPDTPYRRFVFWIQRDYVKFLHEFSPCITYILQLALEKNYYRFHYDTLSFHSIQAKIFHIIEENLSSHFGKEASVSLCINDLLLYMSRTVYEMEHPETLREEQKLYHNVIHHIEHHLTEELSLEQIAQAFYVSKYHIAHIFKEHMGISLHQYITKKRLARCRDSILSGVSISKAYALYGFSDYSSFFRAFKKEYGISPKEYREQHIPEYILKKSME